MGSITIYAESEYEVYVDDIVDNLHNFNSDELLELKEEIDSKLSKTNSREDTFIISASTLDEEYKIQILKEMFDKFSWFELEEVKKKIM